MKLNIKTVLIIFLVALLGSGIGTFGIMELKEKETKANSLSNLEVQQISYDPVSQTDYTKAIEKAFDTVVEITSSARTASFFGTAETKGMGSGVIVSSDGYIVTNHHVVNGAYSVTVKLSSGKTYEAEIIGSDSRTDIALLKIDANDLKYATFVDSDSLEMGQEVIAIGNPLGQGVTCTNGIISALEKEILLNNVYMDLLQTNASINEGNSGGGLFDIYGNLVGIVNAKSSSSAYASATVEGMGYAIPANRALWVIESLKEYGYVKERATLGVKVNTAFSTSGYFYSSGSGLPVTEIIPGGGAEEAGIQAEDIILEADGTTITSYAVLNKVLDSHEIGDVISVTVQRGNDKLTFDVTLKEATSN